METKLPVPPIISKKNSTVGESQVRGLLGIVASNFIVFELLEASVDKSLLLFLTSAHCDSGRGPPDRTGLHNSISFASCRTFISGICSMFAPQRTSQEPGDQEPLSSGGGLCTPEDKGDILGSQATESNLGQGATG